MTIIITRKLETHLNKLKGVSKMKNLVASIQTFLQEEEGLTTVEYAVAGTLIALAVVAAFSQLGNSVGDAINGIESVIAP